MIKNKKQMISVISVFALIMMLGTVTYAFFNYTRTGVANVISTGQINFVTTQSSGQDGAISLTNVFPIDVSAGIPANDPNIGEVTINITGDTEYTGGIEYLVTATDVTNTVGNKAIPIGINITTTSGLGTSDAAYFTNRGSSQTSIYQILAGDTLDSDIDLVVGYIKSGETGVNGNIVIKAYLDASKIAISDTYYENATATLTPTAPTDNYGTTTEWVDGRVVLTTAEWNSLQTNGVSFKVKVIANEDTWVTPTIATCPGCEYIFSTTTINYGGASGTVVSTLTGVTSDYTSLNKNAFLGFTKTQDGKVDRIFACGIKGPDRAWNNSTNEYDIIEPSVNQGTPFCIEGATDGSKYTDNLNLLTGPTLWDDSDGSMGRCQIGGTYVLCSGVVSAVANDSGPVSIGGSGNCNITYNGTASCITY